MERFDLVREIGRRHLATEAAQAAHENILFPSLNFVLRSKYKVPGIYKRSTLSNPVPSLYR
jgi:hypothetical protein